MSVIWKFNDILVPSLFTYNIQGNFFWNAITRRFGQIRNFPSFTNSFIINILAMLEKFIMLNFTLGDWIFFLYVSWNWLTLTCKWWKWQALYPSCSMALCESKLLRTFIICMWANSLMVWPSGGDDPNISCWFINYLFLQSCCWLLNLLLLQSCCWLLYYLLGVLSYAECCCKIEESIFWSF